MPCGKSVNVIDTRLYFLGCIVDRMRVATENRGWGNRNALGGLAADEYRWLQVPRVVWEVLREPVEQLARLSDLSVDMQEPYWVTHGTGVPHGTGHSPDLPGRNPVLSGAMVVPQGTGVPYGNVAIAFKHRPPCSTGL